MTKTELGWAAGFWEGEGYCRSRKGGGGFEVSACQTDPKPIYKLQVLFGGTASVDQAFERLRMKKGKSDVWSRKWTWSITGEAAREFVRAILPHVQSDYKRQQLENALAVPLKVRRWAIQPKRLAEMKEAVKHMDRSQKYGKAVKQLAKRFGVSPKTIYNIREGYSGIGG